MTVYKSVPMDPADLAQRNCFITASSLICQVSQILNMHQHQTVCMKQVVEPEAQLRILVNSIIDSGFIRSPVSPNA